MQLAPSKWEEEKDQKKLTKIDLGRSSFVIDENEYLGKDPGEDEHA